MITDKQLINRLRELEPCSPISDEELLNAYKDTFALAVIKLSMAIDNFMLTARHEIKSTYERFKLIR